MTRAIVKFADGNELNATATELQEVSDLQSIFLVKIFNGDKLVAVINSAEVAGVYLSEKKTKEESV